MTRILTNLLIAFGLFLLLLVVIAGIGLLASIYGEMAVLIVFFFMFAMVILYLGVSLYRGDL